jgi:hypothetical protein
MRPINKREPKLPNLPNATLILVFGILSIGLSCFFGVAFGIVALILYKKEKEKYIQSPESYSKNSFGMLNAGKTCAIIGTIVSSVATLFMILYIIFIGVLVSSFSSGYWNIN